MCVCFLHDRSLTPDYGQVLESAERDVLDICLRLKMREKLEESRLTVLRYFCEAILLKKHHLTENALLNFQVYFLAVQPSVLNFISIQHVM